MTSEPTTIEQTPTDNNDDSNINPTSTTDKTDKQETHLTLTMRQRQRLQLNCIKYLSLGMSIKQISEVEGITEWHCKRVLDGIQKQAKYEVISGEMEEKLPLSLQVRLEVNRILTQRLWNILNSSKDARCVMQAAAQISALQRDTAETLSSINLISDRLGRVVVLEKGSIRDREGEQDMQSEDKELSSSHEEEQQQA